MKDCPDHKHDCWCEPRMELKDIDFNMRTKDEDLRQRCLDNPVLDALARLEDLEQ